MRKKVLCALFAIACVWTSYYEFKQIDANGYLRGKNGYILNDWIMYPNAAIPIVFAIIAICMYARKSK
jgi:hypothetical protein